MMFFFRDGMESCKKIWSEEKCLQEVFNDLNAKWQAKFYVIKEVILTKIHPVMPELLEGSFNFLNLVTEMAKLGVDIAKHAEKRPHVQGKKEERNQT